MDLYGEKKNAIRTVVFLCAILLLFFIADIVQKDRVFSEGENRILASRPKLTKETLLDGTYMKEYENYLNDQFVGRDNWITIKTGMDKPHKSSIPVSYSLTIFRLWSQFSLCSAPPGSPR